MSRATVKEYRLTPAAQNDLDDIWDYTARRWSAGQAEAYLRALAATLEKLVANPEIARERPEISPPVRLHPYASHAIIYRIESDHIAIIRIAHARQNWAALLDP